MNKYIEILLIECKKAFKKKEVPISALIVCNNHIIAKAYNNRVKNNDVTAHAEIIAIRKAEKKMGDWRLDNCDLYITLEPCHMCMEVIKEARIKNVYYLLPRNEQKKPYGKTNIRLIQKEYLKESEEYHQILSNFFKLNGKRK